MPRSLQRRSNWGLRYGPKTKEPSATFLTCGFRNLWPSRLWWLLGLGQTGRSSYQLSTRGIPTQADLWTVEKYNEKTLLIRVKKVPRGNFTRRNVSCRKLADHDEFPSSQYPVKFVKPWLCCSLPQICHRFDRKKQFWGAIAMISWKNQFGKMGFWQINNT